MAMQKHSENKWGEKGMTDRKIKVATYPKKTKNTPKNGREATASKPKAKPATRKSAAPKKATAPKAKPSLARKSTIESSALKRTAKRNTKSTSANGSNRAPAKKSRSFRERLGDMIGMSRKKKK